MLMEKIHRSNSALCYIWGKQLLMLQSRRENKQYTQSENTFSSSQVINNSNTNILQAYNHASFVWRRGGRRYFDFSLSKFHTDWVSWLNHIVVLSALLIISRRGTSKFQQSNSINSDFWVVCDHIISQNIQKHFLSWAQRQRAEGTSGRMSNSRTNNPMSIKKTHSVSSAKACVTHTHFFHSGNVSNYNSEITMC